jgi:CRISPR type III-B/RAMP module RAMP protein Cmr6
MALRLSEWWNAGGGEEGDRYEPGHVGLYLDRCQPHVELVPAKVFGAGRKEDEGDKAKLHRRLLYLSAVEALKPGRPAVSAYLPRFGRWQATWSGATRRQRRIFEVESLGRVLLHPGTGQTVTDGTVLMHHTYGVPYLPGSGLKGLARVMGRVLLNAATPVERASLRADLDALFGPERDVEDRKDAAALVDFVDALWVPRGKESPLEVDVVTPHHTNYYTKADAASPGDWEQPVPTQRLAVGSGVRFLVILEGAGEDPGQMEPWLDLAEGLLVRALADLGFGAWTRSGYGRMKALLPERPGKGKAAPQAVGLAPFVGMVKWTPNTQELSVTMENGKTARAKGAAALVILDTLPPEDVARLKKQGTRRFEISLKESGGVPVIAGLTVPEGRS